MPVEKVTAEEWERLTGSRGSVYIEMPPARPGKKSRRDLCGYLPEETVYLCPQCYELCSGSRPGVLRCDPCGKTWR